MYKGILYASTLALFLLSEGSLYYLGIPYTQKYGSFFAKIHPSLYLFSLLAMLLLAMAVVNGGVKFYRHGIYHFFLFSIAVFYTIFAFLRPDYKGGEVTALAVTFLTPTVMYYCLFYADDAQRKKLYNAISLFFIINSLVGIWEFQTGMRLFPFIAGEGIKEYDWRSTAFLGHPLNNACLTGSYLIYQLLSSRSKRSISWLLQIVILLLSMFAFGGRSAMATLALLLLVATFLSLIKPVFTGKTDAAMRRSLWLLATALIFVPLMFSADFVRPAIERFSNDGGSAVQRLAAIQILSGLTPSQLLIGTSTSYRTTMYEVFNTKSGIEVSWIALAVEYGLPFSLMIALTLSAWLFRLGSGGGRAVWWMIVYFLLVIAGSLSIGSKSVLLAQFALMVTVIANRENSLENNSRNLESISGKKNRIDYVS